MRVIKLKSRDSPSLVGGLFCLMALLAPWLSSLPGLWMPAAGAAMAMVFALALEDDHSLSCRRLLIGRDGLLAINHDNAWHTVARWRLVRLFAHRVELSVQTEGQRARPRRICLGPGDTVDPADYAILRHYLLSASRLRSHERIYGHGS